MQRRKQNRWSFKPELRYSQRFKRNWLLDAYGGLWFFTTNPEFFVVPPPPQPQSLSPLGSFEGHLSHDAKPRFWLSFDGDYWFGGTATVGGVENPQTKQVSSRLGATGSVPFRKHQAIKISWSNGDYYRYGGNYQSVSIAWQFPGWESQSRLASTWMQIRRQFTGFELSFILRDLLSALKRNWKAQPIPYRLRRWPQSTNCG